MTDTRRMIPSVDRLLGSAAFAPLLDVVPRARVLAALQHVQERIRTELAAPAGVALERDDAWYAGAVRDALAEHERASLRPVLNATGVVLHTNLGRAPLAEEALAAIARVAGGYANLEYDVERGVRGSRYDHCTGLLRELTGAEAALVVNNNAAALVLALNTTAAGHSVLVSRGELVEIGDGFRVPEIIGRSGAQLHEVGATNRTHVADYVRALDGEVRAILKVHRSNFRMTGFVAQTDIAALAQCAHTAQLPLVHDLGSGLLIEPERLGLPAEPTARTALQAGADVVAISGDKLLGGPQAGILLGNAELIERMRANPLCRALRVDKLALAALEATLALYRDPAQAVARIPTLRMIVAAPSVLEARARGLAAALTAHGVDAAVVPADGAVGGGAFPETPLSGFAVALSATAGAARLDHALRHGSPIVVGRISDDRLLLDVRTLPEDADAAVVDAVRAAVA